MRTALLSLLLTALAAAEPASWTYPDLPADPAVTWGRLGNGLVYAVRSHPEPKGKLSIRAHVQVGSVQEQDAEQGLAHYLEHLAFQGSKHFPAGCLIDRLQQIGIAHGSHSNAHTSFEETVYKLDLPDLEPATLELGFLAVSDMVGRLDLPEDRVENERGVIRAEMRDRDDAGFRVSKKLYPALLPGLLLPRRFPIGEAATVDAMDRELIAAFYRRWYRPDRIMVAVAGDLPAERLQELVVRYFADLPAEKRALTLHRAAGAPVPLLVVGQPGWGGVDVAGRAAERGLADRVRFLGWRDDRAALFHAAKESLSDIQAMQAAETN